MFTKPLKFMKIVPAVIDFTDLLYLTAGYQHLTMFFLKFPLLEGTFPSPTTHVPLGAFINIQSAFINLPRP